MVGPLAVLLLVGAELNDLGWESEGPRSLRVDARVRLTRIAGLAALGLVASTVVGLAGRVRILDATAAVVAGAVALAAVARVLFPAASARASAGDDTGGAS